MIEENLVAVDCANGITYMGLSTIEENRLVDVITRLTTDILKARMPDEEYYATVKRLYEESENPIVGYSCIEKFLVKHHICR